MNPARAARLPFTEGVLLTMSLFREIGTTVLLLILTLWLQSAGRAALIFWVRRAVAGDLHRLGPFRSTAHYLKSHQIETSSGEWYVFAVNLAALAIVLRAIAANIRIPIRIASPASTVSTVSASTVSTSN